MNPGFRRTDLTMTTELIDDGGSSKVTGDFVGTKTEDYPLLSTASALAVSKDEMELRRPHSDSLSRS